MQAVLSGVVFSDTEERRLPTLYYGLSMYQIWYMLIYLSLFYCPRVGQSVYMNIDSLLALGIYN